MRLLLEDTGFTSFLIKSRENVKIEWKEKKESRFDYLDASTLNFTVVVSLLVAVDSQKIFHSTFHTTP